MSRSGELSDYTHNPRVASIIQSQRDSTVFRRGENKTSMWDGKLEDSIAGGRRGERSDNGNYKQRDQRGMG